jgi:hypothetical protein
MRRHHLIILWAFTASRSITAQESDSLFGNPGDGMSPNSGPDWDLNASLFDSIDAPYAETITTSTTDDGGLLHLDNDSFSTLLADHTDMCSDQFQTSSPPGRIRARGAVCSDGDSSKPPKIETNNVPSALKLMTQEAIDDYWCPTSIFQGILNTPVCSEYEEVESFTSTLMDAAPLSPLNNMGLKKIFTCSLRTSLLISSIFLCISSKMPRLFPRRQQTQRFRFMLMPGLASFLILVTPLSWKGCLDTRIYCCLTWLPRERDVSFCFFPTNSSFAMRPSQRGPPHIYISLPDANAPWIFFPVRSRIRNRVLVCESLDYPVSGVSGLRGLLFNFGACLRVRCRKEGYWSFLSWPKSRMATKGDVGRNQISNLMVVIIRLFIPAMGLGCPTLFI